MRKNKFIKLVADMSDEYVYNVKPVYEKMIEVMIDLVAKHGNLFLEGIGRFKVKFVKGKLHGLLTGGTAMSKDAYKVKFKPSKKLKAVMNAKSTDKGPVDKGSAEQEV